jgi:exopolysaccharide biosynthesis polyprenyl glycosylphosphotransferase
MGGLAYPYGDTPADEIPDFVPDLTVVAGGLTDRHASRAADAVDDLVVDLRTGDPVLELAPAMPLAAPGRLARAAAWKHGVKRIVDVTIAVAALVVLAPLFAAAAAAVKLTSPGPVFYSQPRVGRNGEIFAFRKFRSMYVGADEHKDNLRDLNEAQGPIFKMKRDPRVTRVGRLLRRLSLDELPQLAHVLSGKMSLVGPRPHLPEEVAEYGPLDYRRLSVKPGITCIWQVSGRSELDFDTWVALDLEYIDRWSLWLDLKLIGKTIPAVLSGRGAY